MVLAPLARALPFTARVALPAVTAEDPSDEVPVENVTEPVGTVVAFTAEMVAVSVVVAVDAILAALAASVMVVPTPGV
jgi:hypothetical protein